MKKEKKTIISYISINDNNYNTYLPVLVETSLKGLLISV